MLQSEHFVRKIARETAYKPIEQAAATAEISESMAEKLRPKVVAMIAAGRERAEIHADADECRAKVQSAKPGSVEYKECFPQLKGRPDEGGAGGLEGKLKAASAKFDDALREVLKIADAQTSTWGRQVMMVIELTLALYRPREIRTLWHILRTLRYLAQDTTAPDTLAGRRCCCAVAGSFIFVLITPRLQYRQFCSTTVTDCATLCARARMRAAAIEICAI